MKPVFQNKFGINNGNCMQAVVASLLELELEAVPEFRGKGNEYTWWEEYVDYMESRGYEYVKIAFNPRNLGGYGEDQLKEIIEGKHEGIKGDFFFASVYSPTLFDRIQFVYNEKYSKPTHAVVVDKELNIVHDPHPHYQWVKHYPLHEWLQYNGVISVDIFKAKTPKKS